MAAAPGNNNDGHNGNAKLPLFKVGLVMTKTQDGGSLKAVCNSAPDAFALYSNGTIRTRTRHMLGMDDEGEIGREDDVADWQLPAGHRANIQVDAFRVTRVSTEVHASVYYRLLMEER